MTKGNALGLPGPGGKAGRGETLSFKPWDRVGYRPDALQLFSFMHHMTTIVENETALSAL